MSLKNNLTSVELERIFTDREPGADEGFKFFSVLVPVVKRDGKLYLLYEVRAKHMARQPGEICFPGGELEQGETTQECALRETYEELGMPQDKMRVINQLDTVYTYSNFAMYCYLGMLEDFCEDDLLLSEDEVAEVFLVSIDELLESVPEIYRTEAVPEIPDDFPYAKVTGGKSYPWRRGKGIVPIYEIDGRVIWGLTARITKRFLEIIKEGMNEYV